MKKILVVLLSLVAVITFFSCNNTPVVEVVQAPTADPESSAVAVDTKVTLECATSGAEILYTTDVAEDPATPYSGSISITTATNIKAVAKKAGCQDSDAVYFYYTIKEQAKQPVFKCNGDDVKDGRKVISEKVAVELTSATPAAKIYYTTDGSKPTDKSALYSTPIYVDNWAVIKAIAVAEGYSDSEVSSCTFVKEGESPDVKYEITTVKDPKKENYAKTTKLVRLYTCVDEYASPADAVTIYYSLNDGETWTVYDATKEGFSVIFDCNVLAYAKKDECKKSETVKFICGPDEIKMGDDGCIHVHFGEPQPVKVSTASVGTETYVEYATCESAIPVIKGFPLTSALRNLIKIMALVSNKYEEDESDLYEDYDYVAQDFILSLSAEGSVLDLLRAAMESVFGGEITIKFGTDSLVVLSKEGVALVNIPIKGVTLSGVIPFSPYQWDGLAISPIYITKDFYGLLIDILQKNLYIDFLWKKGVESTDTPLTGFAILDEYGETVVEKDFPKASAKLQYYYDKKTGDVIFAQEFYSADNQSDRSKFAQETGITVVTQPGDKLTTSTNYRCTTLTDKDTDLIYFYNLAKSRGKTYFVRQSYGIDVVSQDNKYIVKRTEILTTITDIELTSKSDCYVTDTDEKPAKFVEMDKNTIKTPLEEGISYFVCLNKYLNGEDNAQSADLFYVNSNNCKYTLSLKDKLDKVLLVIASGKDNITGFYNRYESKKI